MREIRMLRCDVEGAGNVARSGYLGQLARQSSTLPRRPFFVPSPGIRFAERAEGLKGPKRFEAAGARVVPLPKMTLG